ncbi:MAG: pyridoxamine 5'-phosphate oxidase family protein [Bdellovibrionota bacterium]
MEKPSNNPSDDPIERFQEWYLEAQNSEMVDADAMALATCSEDAIPSCRILYFRRLMGSSFCFFTNYLSHKGEDLGLNPWASGVFLWHMLGRQVRVEARLKSSLQRTLMPTSTKEPSKASSAQPLPGKVGSLKATPSFFQK